MVKVGLHEIPLFSIYIKAEPSNRIQRGNLHFHGLLLTSPATPPPLPPTHLLPNLSTNHKSLSHPTHTFLVHSHSRTIVIHSHYPPPPQTVTMSRLFALHVPLHLSPCSSVEQSNGKSSTPWI